MKKTILTALILSSMITVADAQLSLSDARKTKIKESAIDSYDIIIAPIDSAMVDSFYFDEIERNKKHIEILMSYEWFVNGISKEDSLKYSKIIKSN